MYNMNANQLQRDIQWILDCPDLLEGDAQHLRLQNIAISADERVEPSTHKVGRYFEHLVAAMLRHSLDHHLHDQSVQIIRDGRTLGELDFIYDDRTGVLTHCEVSLKYYLYYPQENSSGSHFIGPNPNDTFENKVSRLMSHQIPLSQTYYPTAKRRESFVKGVIFYPYGLDSPLAYPQYLSRDHYRGTWLYARDVSKLADNAHDTYSICQKPHWLSPAINETTMLSPSEIRNLVTNHFGSRSQPLMISRLRERQGHWIEQERLMIVSNQWPHSSA